jgi:hypothetical protein
MRNRIFNQHIKKHLIIAVMLLSAFNFSSCKKWLELTPEDGLIEQEYWQTKEQLKAAVMGAYASLLNESATKYMFMWGELRGDMVTTGFDIGDNEDVSNLNSNRREQLFILRTELDSRNSIVNWEAFYNTINYCNDIIVNGDKVLATDQTISTQQVQEYLAEAYALRGLMYFYLVRSFGEVPLKIEPTNKDTDIKPMAKSSQTVIINQIIEDLKYAEANAPVTYGNLKEDRGRITTYTASTILADVYLWNEDYDNSIMACDKVINSGKYQLFPTGSSQLMWYNSVFRDGNSIEGIFEINFDAQKRNPFWNMFGSGGREFRAKDWVVEGDLYGVDFLDQDNNDIRGNGTSFSEATGAITKFTAGRTDATSISNWFVYRYADVLLMKAEALAWQKEGDATNGQLALDIVNNLRLNRNALTSTGSGIVEIPDPSETLAISDFILEERAREFAFEGKRWYDILRHSKRNNYQNIQLLLSIASSNAIPSKQQTVINKYRDYRSHYFPIYFTELQTNKLLIQNPFY